MIIWSFRALTPMQSWSVGLQCVKKIKENNTNTVTVRALVMSTQPNHASHNITWTFMRYVMLIMSLYTLILKLFHLNSNIGAFFMWNLGGTHLRVYMYIKVSKSEKKMTSIHKVPSAYLKVQQFLYQHFNMIVVLYKYVEYCFINTKTCLASHVTSSDIPYEFHLLL